MGSMHYKILLTNHLFRPHAMLSAFLIQHFYLSFANWLHWYRLLLLLDFIRGCSHFLVIHRIQLFTVNESLSLLHSKNTITMVPVCLPFTINTRLYWTHVECMTIHRLQRIRWELKHKRREDKESVSECVCVCVLCVYYVCKMTAIVNVC